MTFRPKIGVTASARGGSISYWANKLAVWLAGGRAVRLVHGHGVDLDRLDGLIIGGGDDLSAELYGGKITPDVRIDPDRDELERSLLARLEERDLPILGICRGAQMINVFFGGTLHQEIREIYQQADHRRIVLPRKTISIDSGSRLSGLIEDETCRVNAIHHQSVDQLGKDLRAVAHDRHGMIQAIEHTDRSFLIGVQWHPEYIPYSRSQRRLFRALVRAAGKTMGCEGRPVASDGR